MEQEGVLLTVTPRIGSVENPIGEHVVFYGPHLCTDCNELVVQASFSQGGVRYDYPEGPIYPNTLWNLHDCGRKKKSLV